MDAKKLREELFFGGERNYTCDLCGREVFENERVCKDCMPRLPWNLGAFCRRCGRKLREEGLCPDCRERPPAVAYARSLFTHEGEAARRVVAFKRGSRYLFRTFTELALPFVSTRFPEADSVTFVPMTERAEKARGYNQSRLLAEAIAAGCGLAFLSPAVKTRETEAQKFLGKREREENLKGCFSVKHRAEVKGRKILIVDDTFTTGATVNELASVLLRAGAEKVYAFTVTSVENKTRYGKTE